jgi:hypothetical protein
MLRYRLHEFSRDWTIPEEPVPESAWHDGCLDLVKGLLAAWGARSGRDAAVFRDIAILARREQPRIGFNPDICLVEPSPPGAAELESLRLWEHTPPRLAFEAVSPNHPYKDYAIIPEKCAITGVGELVVFDPLLAGPRAQGGPWLLQVWQRAPDDAFERVYAGDGAASSAVLGAWFIPDRVTRRLRVAEHQDGSAPWLTLEEAARESERQARQEQMEARQAQERAHRAKEEARRAELEARDAERRAVESAEQAREREARALARVAELEAEMKRRSG